MFDRTKPRLRFRMVIPAYPAFNIYSHIARKTTALGPVSVASGAHKLSRWDVEVVDENNPGRFGPVGEGGGLDHERMQRERPADVVGFYGGLTSTVPRLYQLARFYRDQGAVTIGGGQHFAGENIQEALQSGLDYVVIGEGEVAIQELLTALETNGGFDAIRGLVFLRDGQTVQTPSRPLLQDFDTLPLPDFSLVRYSNITIYPIERTRGCGMDCEFCTVKGRPRFESIARFVEQVSVLVESHNASCFFIVDDLFGQQRNETIELCNRLYDYQKQLNKRLEFTVQIRLDKARDPELLEAMRRAGVRTVAIGFESPIDEELEAMHKHIRAADMLNYTRIFRRHKFLVHGMFIFGYPLADGGDFHMTAAERARQFRRFIRRARIDTIQVLLPVPLPGTLLRDRLQGQGRIYPVEEVGWEYYDGSFPLFEPDAPMTAQDMQAAARTVMARCYRFAALFGVITSVLSFPGLIFHLYRLRTGWLRWYRSWRNSLIHFGGWITIRKWNIEFDKGEFPQKLRRAQARLQPGVRV